MISKFKEGQTVIVNGPAYDAISACCKEYHGEIFWLTNFRCKVAAANGEDKSYFVKLSYERGARGNHKIVEVHECQIQAYVGRGKNK